MAYKILVKRRDLIKLEVLIRFNKVKLLNPNLCYFAIGSPHCYAHYIWPRAWGIKGKREGYSLFTRTKITKEEALNQLEMSLEELENSFINPNIEYIIDEEIFSNN